MHHNKHSSASSPTPPRRGLVLIAVLVTVVVLALLGYKYNDLTLSEFKNGVVTNRQIQTRAAAESAIHYAAAVLAAYADDPEFEFRDNPEFFHGVVLRDDANPRLKLRFSMVSPLDVDEQAAEDGSSFRFGLIDESAKLNLNALLRQKTRIAKQVLMKLPNMTDEIASAILDWIDSNDKVGGGVGAENENYLPDLGYRAKNAPMDSLEEMLLIQGVTPQLLFGNDRLLTGQVTADMVGPLDRGWAAWLTVFSRESNLDPYGNPRVNLAETDFAILLESLANAVDTNEVLDQEMATYIALYLAKGPSTPPSKAKTVTGRISTGTGGTLSIQLTQPASDVKEVYTDAAEFDLSTLTETAIKKPIKSVFDLVDTYVLVKEETKKTTTGKGKNAKTTETKTNTYVASPIQSTDMAKARQYLGTLLNATSYSGDTVLWGRTNVQTAPPAVLRTLPGLDEQMVMAIANKQKDVTEDPIYQSVGWLFTEANIPLDKMKQLEPLITTRSQAYRMQVIGHFDDPLFATTRMEAVIDLNPTGDMNRPRILYIRDLTELGSRSFNVTVQQ